MIEDPVDRLSLSPAKSRHAAYSPLRSPPRGSVRATCMTVGAMRVSLGGVMVTSSFYHCPGTCVGLRRRSDELAFLARVELPSGRRGASGVAVNVDEVFGSVLLDSSFSFRLGMRAGVTTLDRWGSKGRVGFARLHFSSAASVHCNGIGFDREGDVLRKFLRTCRKFLINPSTLAKIYPAERRVLTCESETASSKGDIILPQ